MKFLGRKVRVYLFVYFFSFIEAELIYNAVLISSVQQSDSIIHVYIHLHILFHYDLSNDFEYSSLCCRVDPFVYLFIHRSIVYLPYM